MILAKYYINKKGKKMTREDFTDEEYALLKIMFDNIEQTIEELRFFGLEINDIDLLNLAEKLNILNIYLTDGISNNKRYKEE